MNYHLRSPVRLRILDFVWSTKLLFCILCSRFILYWRRSKMQNLRRAGKIDQSSRHCLRCVLFQRYWWLNRGVVKKPSKTAVSDPILGEKSLNFGRALVNLVRFRTCSSVRLPSSATDKTERNKRNKNGKIYGYRVFSGSQKSHQVRELRSELPTIVNVDVSNEQ